MQSKTFKNILAKNEKEVVDILKNIGYEVRVFPLREKGINQSNFRKIEITDLSTNLMDKLRKTKKLREIDWIKY